MDISKYKFCSEFYEVEKSIEVVVKMADKHETVRIEALHSLISGYYRTRAYINAQPTYPEKSVEFGREVREGRMWIDYDLPWTHCNTAEECLNQALLLLKERCSSL